MLIHKSVADFTTQELKELGIEGFSFDSREAQAGDLFCALPGVHTDGHHYLDMARKNGVKHFLISDSAYESPDGLYLLVADTRSAMAHLASIFYQTPSDRIKVIGVTGTDGKSTTSYLIQQLLEMSGHPCGLMSTINFKLGMQMQDNNLRQSTPEAPQIEQALDQMCRNGLEYAVVEATSHGLSDKTGRLSHIKFIAAAFTNVTIEHLEFHQTLEQYRADKANLFRQVDQFHREDGFGVINGQSEHAKIYLEACGQARAYQYGQIGQDLWAEETCAQTAGTHFLLCCKEGKEQIFVPLPGLFNVENVLCAVLCVSRLLRCSPLSLAQYIGQLKGPAGRMVVIQDQPYTVIVDYAHTPGSFEKILPQIKQTTEGKLIVLFGSGGERNLEKRPMQGQLADQYADIVILTDEDPRLESSKKILEEIATGIKNKKEGKDLFLISDRREAICHACALAEAGDTVMLLGKGHEGCIIVGEEKTPWDEEAVAREAVKLKG
ncbi:MAG: UDP-N-acetylmuramoyl-L-alanyl-D-glutamate--2,6-diaminopimelate ligase [Spirochaetia bacterium]